MVFLRSNLTNPFGDYTQSWEVVGVLYLAGGEWGNEREDEIRQRK